MARLAAYYRVLYPNDKIYGVGYAPPGTDLVRLFDNEPISNWTPIHFTLRDGIFPDYLATNIVMRLCSQKLRAILDEMASESDILRWLPVKVDDGTVTRAYDVLHFPECSNDVLDRSRCIMGPERVVKPVFLASALRRHQIFSYPGKSAGFFVSATVKRAMQSHGCTGMTFSKVPVAEDI